MDTSVTFSEENSARPTYIAAATATFVSLSAATYKHLHPDHVSGWLINIMMFTLIGVFAAWVRCIMGCIWHPIPQRYRKDGGATLLHLDPSEPDPPADDPEEQVDSISTELREQIQWSKIALTTLALAACGLAFTAFCCA